MLRNTKSTLSRDTVTGPNTSHMVSFKELTYAQMMRRFGFITFNNHDSPTCIVSPGTLELRAVLSQLEMVNTAFPV